MTPAIKIAKRAKISYKIHEYSHDPDCGSYGIEAADKIGVAPERVFKTLVVDLGNKVLAVAVIPVTDMLSLKKIAKAAGAKKAVMADKHDVARTTGYVLGGVSPLGQKKRLKTVIDSSAENFDSIFVSGGRRGLDIELNPADLKTLTNGVIAELTQ